jgi:hypothetical protein
MTRDWLQRDVRAPAHALHDRLEALEAGLLESAFDPADRSLRRTCAPGEGALAQT